MMTEGRRGGAMTVSGSTNFTLNANQIIDKAFHRLGKASEGEAMSARMYEDGRSSLNLILKSKLGTSDRLFLRTEGSVTLIAGTAAAIQSGLRAADAVGSSPRQQQRRHADARAEPAGI
jgi:hypothetical protein